MSRVYMIRHGQTLFNVLRRKQGWCDSPLTEVGIDQARAAGAYLREHGITFDHVYSSTSERCCDTTELVVPGQPYERVKGLKEWYFGKFEGVSEDLNPPTLPYGDFFVPFGGEAEMDFRARLVRTVTDLMLRPNHECVLMVSHGAAIAQFPRAFGFDIAQVTGKHVGNCGVAVYDFDGRDRFELLEVINPNV